MAFMVCSCESILEVADNSENPLTEELGLDRSNCISCSPTISNQTLENQELTFNTNHMPCIHLEMNAADFEQMRNESRFGPKRQRWATLWTGLILQANQCDVPYPSQFNWYAGNITIDAQAGDADIIFKGTDSSSDITALTLDMSEAGAATFNNKVVATELDISGDVDIDGTLEADAITVDGTTLAEYISDTTGAMFSSNTETGITATYQDGDGTIDLVVGTLNQDTTGNAATATALETARTIGGTSFDGTANIAVGLAATATALASARTIGGTSFDGTANIVPGTSTCLLYTSPSPRDRG